MDHNPDEDDGVVLGEDPFDERDRIDAHRSARPLLSRQRRDDVTDTEWMRAVLVVVAMVAIVVAAYFLLVAGPGNPAAPQPCMPPSCV